MEEAMNANVPVLAYVQKIVTLYQLGQSWHFTPLQSYSVSRSALRLGKMHLSQSHVSSSQCFSIG
eukprot:8501558-Ditylum_brightwellii.AAC.1